MTRRIAILTSTRPLRMPLGPGGDEKESLDAGRLQKLAERFDLIIIGSKASDDFFKLMRLSLPKKTADKFRLYSRSFFTRFKRGGVMPSGEDYRDEGWQAIFEENGIQFVDRTPVRREDGTPAEIPFTWKRIRQFLRDTRVTLIESPEDILLD